MKKISSSKKIFLIVSGSFVGLFLLLSTGCTVFQPVMFPGDLSEKQADEKRLEDIVKALTTEFYPLSYTHGWNQQRAEGYILQYFSDAGLELRFQEYIDPDNGNTFYNLIGFKKGKTDRRIVIGAHFDTCGDTPGANDNASAVAALIELAYLMRGENDFECDLEFVAYNTEEPPYFGTELMGSYIHAASLAEEKVDVKMMFCMDVIGYYSDEPGSQQYPLWGLSWIYGSRADFITLIGPMANFGMMRTAKAAMKGATDLPVYSINAPMTDTPGISFSDHRNYMKFGYPVLLITDTTIFRSDNYHTLNDTWDTLNYKNIGKVAVGLYEAVRAIDKD